MSVPDDTSPTSMESVLRHPFIPDAHAGVELASMYYTCRVLWS